MAVTAPGSDEVLRFRDLVERSLGLHFDDGTDRHLQRVLARRAAAQARTVGDYLVDLATRPDPELPALATELTVGETYFLRHVEQFDALTGTVLPRLLPGRGPGPVRLLSAGCSTGEEAYSLAIAVREATVAVPVEILGVDVNPASIAKARAARYTDWSLRAVPDGVRRRWFTHQDGDVVPRPEVRDGVRFELRNFARPDREFWRPDRFEVVFCRNVVMYFGPERMAAVIDRIADSMVPGGYLFLGSAETLRGVTSRFRLCESDGTFYYQYTGEPGPDPDVRPAAPTVVALTAAAAPPSPSLVGVSRGVPATAVRSPATSAPPVWPTPPAPARPAPAPARPAPARPAAAPAATAGGAGRLNGVLDLLLRERFADALAEMDALPGPPDTDPDTLLVRAALLIHSGRLAAAESACQHLLRLDRRSAGAHVLLAMCREEQDDLPAAAEHCRTAIRLDPDFAMPHVHLGRLALRMGDRRTASRQYAQSQHLLPGETGHRILLFGGGFDREALISLCRQGARAGADG